MNDIWCESKLQFRCWQYTKDGIRPAWTEGLIRHSDEHGDGLTDLDGESCALTDGEWIIEFAPLDEDTKTPALVQVLPDESFHENYLIDEAGQGHSP